ncbi:MAG: DUF928 domain-containing protein [Cyanobacteria bacterium J06649_4]
MATRFGWLAAWLMVLPVLPAQSQGLSQPSAPISISSSQSVANLQLLPTPPDQGAPSGRQRGGATRGDCLAYQDLTALIPSVDGVVWSETASDAPSFFFDIPAPLTSQTSLEFVIQDSNDNYTFRQELAVEADAGIVEFAIPAGKATLTPGETYAWTLSVYCDAARPSASVSVTGTLKRVDPRLVSVSRGLPEEGTASEPQMDALSDALAEDSLMLVRQYAAVGLWHESIKLAFDLYRNAPSNTEYVAPIEALLDQAGLADVPLSIPQL